MTTFDIARTLPELCEQNSRRAPDTIAVLDDRGGSHTYASLYAEAIALARSLKLLGVGRGDIVALLAPNSVEWIVSAVASQLLGAQVAAFHTWVKSRDLDYLMAHSEACVLLVSAGVGKHSLLEPVKSLIPEAWESQRERLTCARYPNLRHVVVLGDDIPQGAHSWEALVRDGGHSQTSEEVQAAAGGGDIAFILYTSGSTADPKAVPLIHSDMIENGFHIGERMGLTAGDKVWLGSPLFWSFGAANALIATFTHQATLVLQEQFDAVRAADQIANTGCTVAYLLPTLVHALRQVPDIQNLLRTVRTGLTIGRPDEVQEVITGLGVAEICNVYGSTETYGNCCVTPHDMPVEQRVHCQGPPLPGVQLRIVDPVTDELLPTGSEGAIEVYGRTTPGYWKDPDGTAKVFTADGWYRTGDIGRIDESGSLVFSTRDTDMIKTGGINVSPAEVEIFISSDPRVAEVVVVGAKDPVRGEVVVAFVQPMPGVGLTEEDVIARCRRELATYKAPRVVHIVKEIPRTATGKLSRRQLRESLRPSEIGLQTDNSGVSSQTHSPTNQGSVAGGEQ